MRSSRGRGAEVQGVTTPRLGLAVLLGAVALAIHQGCGGADFYPINPFADLERRTGGNLDGTAGATVLVLESLQPREAHIGDYVYVHGRGRIFPAGFARFVFSGNAEAQVEIPAQTGTLRVRVPFGAISGALGFVISQQSDLFDRGGGNQATGPAPQSYALPHPGLRILGPGEPPGGFPNSPYPEGPPAASYGGPDLAGAPGFGSGVGPN